MSDMATLSKSPLPMVRGGSTASRLSYNLHMSDGHSVTVDLKTETSTTHAIDAAERSPPPPQWEDWEESPLICRSAVQPPKPEASSCASVPDITSVKVQLFDSSRPNIFGFSVVQLQPQPRIFLSNVWAPPVECVVARKKSPQVQSPDIEAIRRATSLREMETRMRQKECIIRRSSSRKNTFRNENTFCRRPLILNHRVDVIGNAKPATVLFPFSTGLRPRCNAATTRRKRSQLLRGDCSRILQRSPFATRPTHVRLS